MHVIVNRESLARALAIANSMIKHNPHGVFNYVMLNAAGDKLTVARTDIRTGVRITLPATVEDAGTIALQARLLEKWASSVASDAAGIRSLAQYDAELSADQLRSSVFGTDYRDLYGYFYDDFPSAVSQDRTFVLPVTALRRAINRVVWETVDGVLLRIGDGKLLLVTTDNFRCARQRVSLSPASPVNLDSHIVVPAAFMRAVAEISSTCVDNARMVVSADSRRIAYELVNKKYAQRIVAISGLISDKFPDVDAIFQRQRTTLSRAVVDTVSFQRALKSTMPFSAENSVEIQFMPSLTATDGTLVMRATTPELGNATAIVSATITGADSTTVLNTRFLRDACADIDDTLLLETGGTHQPCTIRPANDDDEFVCIIMPIDPGKE